MANTTHKDKSSGQGTDLGQTGKDMGNAGGAQGRPGGQGGNKGDATRGDQGFAAGAMHKAEEAAGFVSDKAKEAASYVGEQATSATGALASGMSNLGSTIRDRAGSQGMMGQAGSAVPDTLESGGRYLEEHGLGGMGDELTNMIRRNPVPALLVGIGIGFLLARATRS